MEVGQDFSTPVSLDASALESLLTEQLHDAHAMVLTQVQLPLAEIETDAGGYDEESHEVGGIGAAAGKVQV